MIGRVRFFFLFFLSFQALSNSFACDWSCIKRPAILYVVPMWGICDTLLLSVNVLNPDLNEDQKLLSHLL